ncbi:MAG: hypothetical protein QOI80_30 [Solirubrobacteraceae bacterium]|nr:hypothetical protein [Solirubrobacteraceae bacterium]
MKVRTGFLATAAVTLLVASPAVANVENTTLLSHTPSGKLPDAPVTGVVMSGDGRVGRYVAYVSAATNITNGARKVQNIYLVKRARPWTNSGSAWKEGPTSLATKGANGDSWSPAFDGFDDVHATYATKCLAFVSKASNLVRGDSAPADVFLMKVRSGKIKRLAGTGGASEVALDGQCRDIAYVKNGKPYLATVNGKGRPHRAGGSGAKTLNLSANGETLTYERRGSVYVYELGKGARKLAAGTHPWSEKWARSFTFERDGKIFQGSLKGAPAVKQVEQIGLGGAVGSQPNMSAGGGNVAYAIGPLLAFNTYKVPKGACTPDTYPSSSLKNGIAEVLSELARFGVTLPDLPGLGILGRAAAVALPDVIEPRMSAHYNYVVYSCENGPAYLTYIGDYQTGTVH